MPTQLRRCWTRDTFSSFRTGRLI